ncbi:MAG: redoxin domain-containing protein [Bradymonadia bacterium]
MANIGTRVPAFKLRGTNQQYMTNENLLGTAYILAFFPAAFTGVCQKELCTFNDSLAQLNTASTTVFGVSVDGPLTQNAFKEQNGLNFHLLSDHDRAATRAFDIAFENFAGTSGYTVSQRAVFIVDADGIVRYSWVAPNPGVEPDYDEVLTASATVTP